MFAIKTEVTDTNARSWRFVMQKTMYGGKHIRAGDEVFVFDSENEGGLGLVARGLVTAAEDVPRRPGIERQTPRVSIDVERKAVARKRLGRAELKTFANWSDGRPETEINFKFYRQATNKIVGLSSEARDFSANFSGSAAVCITVLIASLF